MTGNDLGYHTLIVSKVVAVPALPSSRVRSTRDESAQATTAASGTPVHLTPVPAGLLTVLAQVVDPRKRRGVRHRLAAVLAIAIAATLAGARSFTAIAEWAADAPTETLTRMGVQRRPPSEATIRRLLTRLPADTFDTVIGTWMWLRTSTIGGRRVIAFDGKTLRGARDSAGNLIHLLAGLCQHTGVVVGQVAVGAKTNEVCHEALCRIPRVVRRNSEGRSWVRWLTWIRKVKGTRACHEYRRSCPDARGDAPGGPRDMAKAILPESKSPVMQVFIHRKRRLKPVPCSASGYFVTDAPSGARAMPSEGIQGDEWGA
ncbi:MAG TPA: transposase family protein [Pseudonocardiaceae bacterium]|nr:transposase family protein [Pseudonocardiaceae bacterium]